jgi:hypothetical protein
MWLTRLAQLTLPHPCFQTTVPELTALAALLLLEQEFSRPSQRRSGQPRYLHLPLSRDPSRPARRMESGPCFVFFSFFFVLAFAVRRLTPIMLPFEMANLSPCCGDATQCRSRMQKCTRLDLRPAPPLGRNMNVARQNCPASSQVQIQRGTNAQVGLERSRRSSGLRRRSSRWSHKKQSCTVRKVTVKFSLLPK